MKVQVQDTTREILRLERERERTKRIAAFGAFLLFALPLASGFLAMEKLLGAGWGAYLHLPPGALPMDALFSCLWGGPCRKALWAVLRAYPVPFWMNFLPGLGLLLFALFRWIGLRGKTPTKLPGAAQFREDWKRELTKGISYLGVKEGHQLAYPKDSRFKHTFILGSTGAGKTSRVIRPMLSMAALEGRSAVVWDLKYPDPSLLFAVELYRKLGHRVMVYLPYEPNSPRVPLLRGAEDFQIARSLAEVVIPVPEKESNTTYYTNIERQLLATLIYIEAQENGDIGEIARQCQRGFKSLRRHIELKAQDKVETLGFFFELPDNMKSSMVAGLAGRLSPFGDPYLARSTSFGPLVDGVRTEELDLSLLGREPTLWYVGIPQRYVMGGAGQIFLQLLKRYLDRVLLEESERAGGPLKVPVEIYLDEFTNLGFLPYMPDVLSTMRSRRVAYILALQSFAQGLERYREEALESILANCNTWIIFGYGLSDVDAERVSKALGRSTVYALREGQSIPHFFDFTRFPSYNRGQTLEQGELLSPEELRALPEGSAVIRFSAGHPLLAEFPWMEGLKRVKGPISKAATLVREIEAKICALEAKLKGLGLSGEKIVQAVADYLMGWALPDRKEEEPKRERKDIDEAFLDWAIPLLSAGENIQIMHDPERGHLTKISIELKGPPPEGLLQWERVRWIKRQKGGEVISIVNDGLEFIKEHHPELIQRIDLMGRIKTWLDKNAHSVEGHPKWRKAINPLGRLRQQGGRTYLQIDRFQAAKLGLGDEEVSLLGGKRTGPDYEIPLDFFVQVGTPELAQDEAASPLGERQRALHRSVSTPSGTLLLRGKEETPPNSPRLAEETPSTLELER